MIGTAQWFEYHCTESHDSCDADAWYRSHRLVLVVGHEPSEDDPGVTPDIYRVRHVDGYEHDAWADELVAGPGVFYRPAPPVVTP